MIHRWNRTTERKKNRICREIYFKHEKKAARENRKEVVKERIYEQTRGKETTRKWEGSEILFENV